MRRWDFIAAYLQGELEHGEVVYCRAPPGYGTLGSDGRARVCKVVKPIYGSHGTGRSPVAAFFISVVASV
eukprot:2092391-Pleurochrysis_carterae.AAC.1